MFIKEITIESFAGLKNKKIIFDPKLNIIYGENEKGKSRIEAFIKCMFYGFYNKKVNGENERKRYLPLNGDKISGELILEYNKVEYLIKRTFGRTKKEDTVQVINKVSGQELNNIDTYEIGKFFIGVNRSTFEKTLFIGQLAVAFRKDKEEEIMDKVTSMFGCGEEEVSVTTALEKLESLKKKYSTARGIGSLDILKKKASILLQEAYEAYKISENNLEIEEKLIKENTYRDSLSEELDKLEVYKKYIKKINLQKEFEEIDNYIRKSESLKEEENKLNSTLVYGNNTIDENFIEEVNKKYGMYLNSLDKVNEFKEQENFYNESYKEKKHQYEEYKYLDLFGDNIKEKIIEAKYKRREISNKINEFNKINKTIINEKERIEVYKKQIINYDYLCKNIDNINNDLENYEKYLKNIKYMMENDTDVPSDNKNEIFKIIIGTLMVLIGILTLIKGKGLFYIGIILCISGTILGSVYIEKNIKTKNKTNNKIIEIRELINKTEYKLNNYIKELGLDNYQELIIQIKKYNLYVSEKNKSSIIIEENKKMLNKEEYLKLKDDFDKNNKILESINRLSGVSDIETILKSIDKYENIKREIEVIEEKIENNKISILKAEEEFNNNKYELNQYLLILDKNIDQIDNLEDYLLELKNKIRKKEEIHRNLLSLEETYKALLKNRDIESIKDQLKDMILDNEEYSYSSIEEIENIEKTKSKELIETEKLIKDLENSINSSMIGKRNIVDIEEDVNNTKEQINKEDKKLKGIELAIKTLNESIDEIRKDVIPVLNRNIEDNFNNINNSNAEIMLNDNYEMIVNRNNTLFRGEYLSNGAYDQLYLSLRIAFINLIFEDNQYFLLLDDPFVQYDQSRRESAIKLLNNKINAQTIIFTCQQDERKIAEDNNISYQYCEL